MPVPQMAYSDGLVGAVPDYELGNGFKSSYRFYIKRAYPNATGWRTANFTAGNYSGSIRVYLAEVPTLNVSYGTFGDSINGDLITYTATFHISGNSSIGNPVMSMRLSSDLGCIEGVYSQDVAYTGPGDYTLTCVQRRNLVFGESYFGIRVTVTGAFDGGGYLSYTARMH